MSIFSTQDVTLDQARSILTEHLTRQLARVATADHQQLDKMLDTYVRGNDEYWRTNFMVCPQKEHQK
jgi:predicted transglutaminase-like cysteine proteinase